MEYVLPRMKNWLRAAEVDPVVWSTANYMFKQKKKKKITLRINAQHSNHLPRPCFKHSHSGHLGWAAHRNCTSNFQKLLSGFVFWFPSPTQWPACRVNQLHSFWQIFFSPPTNIQPCSILTEPASGISRIYISSLKGPRTRQHKPLLPSRPICPG